MSGEILRSSRLYDLYKKRKTIRYFENMLSHVSLYPDYKNAIEQMVKREISKRLLDKIFLIR